MTTKKFFISLVLTLISCLFFGKDNSLTKMRQKYSSFNSISFNIKAFYPNPETDEIITVENFTIINNYNKKNFDFYNKKDDWEEVFKSNNYFALSNSEKVIRKYEQNQNQVDHIQNSNTFKYGPTFLLNRDWKQKSEVLLNKVKQAHYSFVEETGTLENGKPFKVEYHIYVSPSYTISKFERKVYNDNKLTQTVTYEYSNYKFSKNEMYFNSVEPNDYALRYFERDEVVPLEKGTKAPDIVATDFADNIFSQENYLGNKTLLIFSGTNCGASEMVANYLTDKNIKLPENLKLITIYPDDSKETVEKYYKNKLVRFSITITNQKDIKDQYQISGFPVAYLIDENGVISESFDGYAQTIDFLKSENKN